MNDQMKQRGDLYGAGGAVSVTGGAGSGGEWVDVAKAPVAPKMPTPASPPPSQAGLAVLGLVQIVCLAGLILAVCMSHPGREYPGWEYQTLYVQDRDYQKTMSTKFHDTEWDIVFMRRLTDTPDETGRPDGPGFEIVMRRKW